MNVSHNQNQTNQSLCLIGFGPQAKAWAKNLSDSKIPFSIYLRLDSKNRVEVQNLGYKLISQNDELKDQDILVLLSNDFTHLGILNSLSPYLKKTATVITAHGLSMIKEKLDQLFPYNFGLLAPKAIASSLRERFEQKKELNAVIYGKDAETVNLIKWIGAGIGITKFIESSFEEEMKADLFSEQALLCSLIPYASKMLFDKMIEKGINPEIAYIESWEEVKLIADAMIEYGPKELFNLISSNAFYGGQIWKDKLITAELSKTFDQIYSEIDSGKFVEAVSPSKIETLKTLVLSELTDEEIQKEFLKRKQNVSSRK